jgi:hypothetical protein
LGGGHSQENLGEKFMPNETTCEIHIRDVLDEKWSSYFAPFTLTIGTDETILAGVVHDQAELFGVLLKIRDSGLTLVSLMPVPSQ